MFVLMYSLTVKFIVASRTLEIVENVDLTTVVTEKRYSYSV